MSRFVLRKIRNGRVKVNGHWFRPSERHLKYDGRLDGMIYLFGIYPPDNDGKLSLVLWGTKEAYEISKTIKTLKDEEKYVDFYKNAKSPEIVNGCLPWYFWMVEEMKK